MNYELLTDNIKGEDIFVLYELENSKIFTINKNLYEILKNNFPSDDVKRILDKINLMLENQKKDYKILNDTLNFITLDNLKLNVTGDCNLKCKYCYANYGKYNCVSGTMDKKTMINAIDKFSKLFSKLLKISFFGGEPLLNQKLIKDCITYIDKNESNFYESISYHIDTNGTILIDKYLINKCNFFISVDGSKKIHNRLRKFKNGKGTYEAIKKNLSYIKEKNPSFIYGIQCSYSKDLFLKQPKTIDSVRNMLNDFTPSIIELNPVFNSENYEVNLIDFYKENVKALFHINENDTFVGDKSILHLIYLLINNIKSDFHCSAGRSNFTVSYNGDIYPCHLFIKDEFKICNVNTDPVDKIRLKIKDFNIKYDTIFKHDMVECQQCWAKSFCLGCVGKFQIMENTKNPSFCKLIKSVLKQVILNLAYLKMNPLLWENFIKKIYKEHSNEND